MARLHRLLPYLVLIGALVYGIVRVVPGPLWFLMQSFPLWSNTSWITWLTSPEWVVMFLATNGLIFFFSLHNAVKIHGVTLIQVVVDNPLTCAQTVLILFAIELLVGAGPGGRPTIAITVANGVPLGACLALGFLANLFAFMDSVFQYRDPSSPVSHRRFWFLWFWQNIGCLFFFGLLLFHIVFGNYAVLASPVIVHLWWIGVGLLVLSAFDVFLQI